MGLTVVLGLVLAALIVYMDYNDKKMGLYNIFYVLYSYYEPAHLLVVLLTLPVFYLGLTRDSLALPGGGTLERILGARWTLPLLMVLVFLGCGLGRLFVYEETLFSQDEFAMDFQAQLFGQGMLKAPVPEDWQPFASAMAPIFITYEEATGSWMASYLPVYAVMLAAFQAVSLGAWLNPVLAALTLWALLGLLRTIWPERPQDALLVTLLLAVSPQFLVTAMSGYTMTAHLLFNLLWLRLYLENRRWGLLALPWVGFLAMGLHAFVPHALFAIPFLLRMVADRRWGLSAYVASVYLMASAIWIVFLQHVNPTIGAVTADRFWFPGWQQFVSQGMSLALLMSWQALPLMVLAAMGLICRPKGNALLFDVMWSCLFTFGLYFFFLHDQGHGWGNRYFHPALGNLAIFAMVGWRALLEKTPRPAALGFVTGGLLLALLVQVPLRLYQVQDVMKPFMRAQEFFATIEQPVVLLPTEAIWYGQDLVRNVPFFDQDPKIFFLSRVSQAKLEKLERHGPIRLVTPKELEALGLTTTRWVVQE